MNRELMNTFTHEQLLMCEKENLLDYINEIKEHHEIVVCELKEKHESVISELFKQIAELKSNMGELVIKYGSSYFSPPYVKKMEVVVDELLKKDIITYKDNEFIMNNEIIKSTD